MQYTLLIPGLQRLALEPSDNSVHLASVDKDKRQQSTITISGYFFPLKILQVSFYFPSILKKYKLINEDLIRDLFIL